MTEETQTQTFGPYEITHLVGRGGMASVYRALKKGPLGFAKEVALKLIKPELVSGDKEVKAFINEARIGGQLRHPNIVEVYEFNRVGKQFFLAMEFVDGWTLDTVVRIAGEVGLPLPPTLLLSVLEQVCRGLHYAHELEGLEGKTLRLVHRDIKPSNIIVGRRGEVKVMDFGIAKSEANLFKTTTADMTKGTPFYMSPEQVRGGELGATSDIFSLGAVMYELCTGQVLYKADNLATVLYRVVKGEMPEGAVERVDACVPGLGEVFARCSRLEPAERYESTGELADVLAELAAALGEEVSLKDYLEDLRFRLTGDKDGEEGEKEGPDDPRFAPLAATMHMGDAAGSEEELFELANAFIGELTQGGQDDTGSGYPETWGADGPGTLGPPTAGPDTEDASPHLRVPGRGRNLAMGEDPTSAKTLPMLSTQLSTQQELRVQRSRPWALVAVLAFFLAAAGFVLWQQQGPDQRTAEPAAPEQPTRISSSALGSVAEPSEPAPSPPEPPPEPATAPVASAPAPPERPTPVSAPAPVAPSPPVEEAPPSPPAEPGRFGVRPSKPNWGWVEVDGERLGRSPLPLRTLAAGPHQVTVIDGVDPSRSCSDSFVVPSGDRLVVPSCNFASGRFE